MRKAYEERWKTRIVNERAGVRTSGGGLAEIGAVGFESDSLRPLKHINIKKKPFKRFRSEF